MNPDSHNTSPAAWQLLRDNAEKHCRQMALKSSIRITVGLATCGIAAGALETRDTFVRVLEEAGLSACLQTVGCMGHCYAEPVVVIDHPGSGFPPLLYHAVTPGKATMLVRHFLLNGDPCLEHVMGAMEANELLPWVNEFARFKQEKRVVLEKCGKIDPESLDEYIAEGGYEALAHSLEQSPSKLIETVKDSGLRGRGGAGFPTGDKWEQAARATSNEKYIICNADEGDPGAYMDRTIIESNPHQLIEGISIASYAVGARRAIVYVRAEYPLAVSTLVT